MAYRYSRQNWENYDFKLEAIDQPAAVITKSRLEHIEAGIEENSMELAAVYRSGVRPSASFRVDKENKRIVLDLTFPIPTVEPADTDHLGGIKAKSRDQEDMEVVIGEDYRLYTGVLRSPNGSKFKVHVDDQGKLYTEKLL